MTRFSTTLALVTGVCCMLFATQARAQPAAGDEPATQGARMKVSGTGASYDVFFDIDQLNAAHGDLLIPRIMVRPRGARSMLLRPRTSFVNEMLTTVELM